MGLLRTGASSVAAALLLLASEPTARAEGAANAGKSLAEESAALRAAFIFNPGDVGGLVGEQGQRALAMSLGAGSPEHTARLSWFMRGATTRIARPSGGAVVVGYYNPIADMWLLTRWAEVAGSWRLGEAAVLRGVDFADGQASPPWVAQPTADLGGVLAQNLAAFDARFSGPDPTGAFADAIAHPAGRLLDDQAAHRLSSIAARRDDARRWRAVEQVRRRIIDHAAAIPGGAGVAAMPDRVRQTLTLAAVLPGQGRRWLVFVSPLAPQIVVIAEADGPRLQRLTLVAPSI